MNAISNAATLAIYILICFTIRADAEDMPEPRQILGPGSLGGQPVIFRWSERKFREQGMDALDMLYPELKMPPGFELQSAVPPLLKENHKNIRKEPIPHRSDLRRNKCRIINRRIHKYGR